ncbi:MAG: porin [Marinifilaceae bacterium]
MKRVLLLLLLGFIVFSGKAQSAEEEQKSLFEQVTKIEKKNDAFNMLLNTKGSYFVNTGDIGERGENGFKMNQLRLTIKGDITKNISYRFQQKLNVANNAGWFDNLPRSIDFAMISLRFNDKYGMNLGRQAIDFGGYEFDANPINVFQYSSLMECIPAFHTGVSFLYNVTPTQELRFQIVDGRIGSFEEEFGVVPSFIEQTKTPLGYVAKWSGSFCDNKIQTLWSASVFHEAQNKNWYYFVAGTQFNFNKFNFYVDVNYSQDQLDRMGMISEIVRDNGFNTRALDTRYTSVVSRLNFQVCPQVNLFVKGAYETAGVGKTADYTDADGEQFALASGHYRTTINYNAGLEFQPWKNSDFKAYATYMGRNVSFTDKAKAFGATNFNPQQAEVGFIYLIPIY